MRSGISLANKCQLLFGFAILVILAGALAVPWIRTSSTIRESQLEVARQLADAWIADHTELGVAEPVDQLPSIPQELPGGRLLRTTLVHVDGAAAASPRGDDPSGEAAPSTSERQFLAAAVERFRGDRSRAEYLVTIRGDNATVYRYARPIRQSHLQAIRSSTTMAPANESAATNDPLRAILVIDRTSQFAEGQLLTSRVFIIAAGIVGVLMAGLVFHFILTKLILSPVRALRETTEKVQAGDLRMRSDIKTGDEFEQLSDAFNTMLERMEQNQAQLRSINESLDLKLNELAETNVGLYESNRFKSEFLANVSHELRTPLNSIIGFAELLDEIARGEHEPNPKRLRYIGNIISSGRSLLEMINELLDMAKIESGRMDVTIEQTSVGDLIEGLSAIMRPQAETKNITLSTVVAQRLPAIETDAGKLQQILYNFLSNAIKFTPAGGTVTISADRVTRQDGAAGVRLAVADTGPGIPYDMQDVIFEKFRQIDASHTREHAGTGLGLAICRELAQMLGATVSFVSEPGRGATFFVDLPTIHRPQAPQPLM